MTVKQQHNLTAKMLKLLGLVGALGIAITTVACGSENNVASEGEANSQTNAVENVKPEAVQVADVKPLAQELQGKPVLVDIYATWCSGCRKIKPALDGLKQQYGDSVNFVVLDVTDKGTTETAEAKAQKLGLESFFEANKAKTATVGILNPDTGEVLKLFQKNPNKADYAEVLDSAIAAQKAS
ncbi:thioredoxin domain-containing protein [Mastigocoleus sp. MO_188.B34]|uniref:thioredoxin domain-containing protein n=1 Tax=Mastigocoleus sp. MO_188.B34 TaxID=3036635 RepID=UPI002616759B|nr:thioredoxin domain-containing protein [Mastigocoleus sp. MO_188.B34]MDJ0694238.1 thioredoxin domain-containing protein [Mastigocoleus sp. MO_188.B34]